MTTDEILSLIQSGSRLTCRFLVNAPWVRWRVGLKEVPIHSAQKLVDDGIVLPTDWDKHVVSYGVV